MAIDRPHHIARHNRRRRPHVLESGDELGIATEHALITVRRDGADAVVAPIGELDLSNRDSFAAVLDRARELAPRRIVVDFDHTEFLDACIVGVLDHEFARGRTFVLTNAHGIVQRVLDIVHLETNSADGDSN